MTDVSRAHDIVTAHLASLSNDDYLAAVRRYEPELLGEGAMTEDAGLAQLGLPGLETTETAKVLALRPRPEHHPLNAYLASALTGLEGAERQLIFQLSDAVSLVCQDLGIELYEPRKKTDPVHHPDVEDTEVFHVDRERVLRSDLLIYLAHYPSTGAGEELTFAYDAMLPIVVVGHNESRISRMVTGIPGTVVTVSYDEPEELRARLHETLLQLRPQLVQRKLAYSDYDVNIIGDRIRQLREAKGLTREDIVKVSSDRHPLSVEMLARLEQSNDKDANPSLLQLREIATALSTTVSDLVEPDMDELIINNLSTWVTDRQAARFGDISSRDRNKLLRRVLLRLIDSLEDD